VSASAVTRSRALYGLLVLTLINLFNYLDRQMMSAVLPQVSREFNIVNDGTRQGYLLSIFVVIYMVVSPLGGYLGDRIPRRFLVAGSVLLWSLATLASGLSQNYSTLLIARGVIGIGEAGYGAAAPSIIADLFSREKRATMLGYFYLAMPLGAGSGYLLGGWLAEKYSWHAAFYVGGAPGLLLSMAMLFAPEPQRGSSEGQTHVSGSAAKIPFLEGLRQLAGNGQFWINTSAYTLMTFAIGGLSGWMPTFLQVERHQSPADAGLFFGAVTVVGGIVGTLLGGWLGDWTERRRAGGGMWISGLGLVLATPFMILVAKAPTAMQIYALCLIAMVLLFLNTGPINAAILNSVPPTLRSFAMGINVLLIHLLGDALSPTAIGAVKDATSLSTAIMLNAAPVLLSGLVLLIGASALAAKPRVQPS